MSETATPIARLKALKRETLSEVTAQPGLTITAVEAVRADALNAALTITEEDLESLARCMYDSTHCDDENYDGEWSESWDTIVAWPGRGGVTADAQSYSEHTVPRYRRMARTVAKSLGFTLPE